MPNLSWGQYNVAVPDFSQVGNDIEERAMRLKQFQVQQQRYEQKRKDMMWKNFLSQTNVKPASLINENLRKRQSAILEGTRQKLIDLTKDNQGVPEWKDMQKGRMVAERAQEDVKKIESWQDQWLEDISILQESKPDEWKPEVEEEVFSWDGKKPYKGSKLTPDARRPKSMLNMISDYSGKFKAGNEYTDEITYRANGKLFTSEAEYSKNFWEEDKDGVLRPRMQEQMSVVRDMMYNEHSASDWAYNFSKLPEGTRERYRARSENTAYNPIELYVYDKARPQLFSISTKREQEPDEERIKRKGGNVIMDGKVVLTKANMKPIETPAFEGELVDYWGATNQDNIDIPQKVNNAIIETPDGKIETISDAKSFEGASFAGVLKSSEGSYVHLRARRGEKVLKKNGNKIYEDQLSGTTGAKKEIIKSLIDRLAFGGTSKEKKQKAQKEFERRLVRGDINLKYRKRQHIDIYAPVESNLELGKLYMIDNTVSQQAKDVVNDDSGKEQSGINW